MSYKSINAENAYLMNLSTFAPSTIGFTAADLSNTAVNTTYKTQQLGSVVNVTSGLATNFTSTITTSNTIPLISAPAGTLFRDMGKTLYVQQGTSNVQIFKYVQLVNGLGSEGVSTIGGANSGSFTPCFYLPVWSAAGTSVAKLVRTGL